jgi:three-Cys-motif partner protein
VAIKPYDWSNGATLHDHTRRKHKILREYFGKYVDVRCRIPKQSRFRLAIIDGFAGAGRYKCGTGGSPIIFIEELRAATDAINLQRLSQDLGPLEIECLLVLNDEDTQAVSLLRSHCEPLVAEIRDSCPKLHLSVQYLNGEFEQLYPTIAQLISSGRYRNVLVNLDQCGYAQVSLRTLSAIMRSAPSVETFLTYAIQTLLAFLVKDDPKRLVAQLRHLGITSANLSTIEGLMGHEAFLGAAEKMVFHQFAQCAMFVSPFSIKNPEGWRYWLIHFANNYRARQVYNNILHDNASAQAHFGRSGLDMLSYDPGQDEGSLYLFDVDGRSAARRQLFDDIPRLLTDVGDALGVADFYTSIYNTTPAHTDDIHQAIMDNDDVEVLTPAGGIRRRANTIEVGDTLRLTAQRTFFPVFFGKK